MGYVDPLAERVAIGKCPKCGTFTLPAREAANECWSVRCPGCRGWRAVFLVAGKRGKRSCGAWCTDGTGRSCTCECEGKNHGSAYSASGALWQAR